MKGFAMVIGGVHVRGTKMASIFILYRYVCIRKEVYMRFLCD